MIGRIFDIMDAYMKEYILISA